MILQMPSVISEKIMLYYELNHYACWKDMRVIRTYMTKQENNQPGESPSEKKKEYKGPWDIRPYLAIGLTAVLVVLVCLAIFFFIFRFQGFTEGVSKIISSLRGILFGLLLAYLLNPVMTFFEKRFRKKYAAKHVLTQKKERTIRVLSVVCAMAIFLAIIAVLLILIVPNLVNSIQELVLSMGDKVDALMSWLERLSEKGGILDNVREGRLETFVQDAFKYLQDWMEQKLLSGEVDIFSRVTAGVYTAVQFIFNAIVGIIVAVYVMMTKEKFVGQAKKLVYAIFRPRLGNFVMEIIHRADDVFGGFFIGKIIDSLIIGFICFVVMYIIRLPYPVLISVIVGVTNIIPFFGPYIGAIPSLVLILMVSPVQALYFLIFIIILQQVDGNIIGPKILGNTTGLSPFWVIFACLLFGGLFGVGGMIFGVPVFAVIYYVIKRIAEHFLRRKKLPEDTAEYVHLNRVDIQTNRIEEWEKDRKPLNQIERNSFFKKKEDNES